MRQGNSTLPSGLVLELVWDEVFLALNSKQGAAVNRPHREVFRSVDMTAEIFENESSSMNVVRDPLRLASAASTRPCAAPPRALLFSSVGDQCLNVVREHWLAEPGAKDFDVALTFYKDISSPVFTELQSFVAGKDSVELQHSPGMKWPNFRKWIQNNGGAAEIASRYDYVWVVDDDVRLHTTQINRFFSILRENPNVEFACPSFDSASDGVWRYFDMHDPKYKLRFTDFVECTAPVIKSSWLVDPQFARVLRAVRTGCFIDFCFFPATGRRKDAVAIIDAVQCHHPPRGEDAPSEMRQLQRWEDHKEDDVHFEHEGVPRDWYWFRQPIVFGGVLVD